MMCIFPQKYQFRKKTEPEIKYKVFTRKQKLYVRHRGCIFGWAAAASKLVIHRIYILGNNLTMQVTFDK